MPPISVRDRTVRPLTGRLLNADFVGTQRRWDLEPHDLAAFALTRSPVRSEPIENLKPAAGSGLGTVAPNYREEGIAVLDLDLDRFIAPVDDQGRFCSSMEHCVCHNF